MATDRGRVPRARDAQATRADLLRAAKRRFTLYGFGPTTSRQIAQDANANVSLINRYFGSKEGLFEAVLQETADTLDTASAQSIAELIDGMMAGFEPDAWPDFGNEHPMLLLLRSGGDERTAELRRRTLAATLAFFGDVVRRESPKGTRDEVVRMRAGLLFAQIVGVITIRDALPDGPFADERLRQLHPALVELAKHLSGA